VLTTQDLIPSPLRLNEVAALAAYFDVPVESLWHDGRGILNKHVRMAADYYTQQRIERLRDK